MANKKNQPFWKKCKKNLRYEFQKTLIFQTTCREWIHFFWKKNFEKVGFQDMGEILESFQNLMKIIVFSYQIPHTTKKN